MAAMAPPVKRVQLGSVAWMLLCWTCVVSCKVARVARVATVNMAQAVAVARRVRATLSSERRTAAVARFREQLVAAEAAEVAARPGQLVAAEVAHRSVC